MYSIKNYFSKEVDHLQFDTPSSSHLSSPMKFFVGFFKRERERERETLIDFNPNLFLISSILAQTFRRMLKIVQYKCNHLAPLHGVPFI